MTHINKKLMEKTKVLTFVTYGFVERVENFLIINLPNNIKKK